MKTPRIAPFVPGLLAASLLLSAHAAVDFANEVAPILQARCIECHGPEKQKGGLRLDIKAGLLKGGKGGPAFKAGDAAGSDLHRRVTLPKDDDDRMPPTGEPLPADQVAILKNWIAEGARWPDAIQIATESTPTPSASAASIGGVAKPSVPAPELPKNFQPAPAEAAAIAALAKQGIDVRPVAQNVPWREVNLRPQAASVTDETLAPLKDIASLIEVRLGATKVTDAGLAAVASLPHLQVLGLELTGVTDAGVARLASLPNLTYLNLYGTAVTDAALDHLKGMKHLRNLYLWQTKVTPEGAKKLQEALPGLDINTGAELALVSTNAPAEKKGN